MIVECIPVMARDLKIGDEAAMYGTVVTITGEPFTEAGLKDGWVRIPMIWAGIKCSPPELATRSIVVRRPPRDA